MQARRPPASRGGAREDGFTLVELVVVLAILGVLLALAVVSYVGFKDRSAQATARANVRAAIPSLEAFDVDRGTYTGATLTILRAEYDLAIDDSGASRYTLSELTTASYCLQCRIGDWYAWTTGPGEPIEAGKAARC